MGKLYPNERIYHKFLTFAVEILCSQAFSKTQTATTLSSRSQSFFIFSDSFFFYFSIHIRTHTNTHTYTRSNFVSTACIKSDIPRSVWPRHRQQWTCHEPGQGLHSRNNRPDKHGCSGSSTFLRTNQPEIFLLFSPLFLRGVVVVLWCFLLLFTLSRKRMLLFGSNGKLRFGHDRGGKLH